ncbi:putative transcription regulator protein [Fulvimarina pelagi HTCC2506]|uniref:Putative transcription regulator protein n=1 Tax=Fulvimarina pelagi HTCC2506 TaxID=314231 RepID=Q0G5J4_9HYPH|nr:MarR family winged helix-turn-helix transcriptional regulator [Fulvimarina pelagi]EAU43070.1 putative transcription regulator protein [Fulvimarina pelagi HTCC2506]
MSDPDAGNSLGFLLTDVARLFRQQLEKAVIDAGIDLTPGEIRALSHVARHEGSRQAVLAERMGVEPMTLSAYLDRLETRGLVKRSPDPNDRRAKVINTTDKADNVFANARPITLEVYDRITRGLSDGERDEIERLLSHVRENMTSEPIIVSDDVQRKPVPIA